MILLSAHESKMMQLPGCCCAATTGKKAQLAHVVPTHVRHHPSSFFRPLRRPYVAAGIHAGWVDGVCGVELAGLA